MPVPIVQVDAFTSSPFAGNPAAVCILDEARPDWWLQDVAREMNLSETAFLLPSADGYELRWFTPTTEVDLCGHATLASAHVLYEAGHLPHSQTARFDTRSGRLTAGKIGDWIEMDFPAQPAVPTVLPDGLASALGQTPLWVGRSATDLLVELDDEKTVRTLVPDLGALSKIDARGVIVTSRAVTVGVDFVSRFFAPRAGVPEDPVTGSAHCTLGPFWASRLDREDLVGYQVSPRGGTVRVGVRGERIALAGQAVTVLRGEILS